MATVLIVDDEEKIREVLKKVLGNTGYEVIEATNGEEALKICAEKKDAIDVVVVDIIYPEKGGPDAIMDLRRDFPDVKIIAVTGGGIYGTANPHDMATGIGADRAIGKPFVLDEFLEAVEELTSEQANAS